MSTESIFAGITDRPAAPEPKNRRNETELPTVLYDVIAQERIGYFRPLRTPYASSIAELANQMALDSEGNPDRPAKHLWQITDCVGRHGGRKVTSDRWPYAMRLQDGSILVAKMRYEANRPLPIFFDWEQVAEPELNTATMTKARETRAKEPRKQPVDRIARARKSGRAAQGDRNG